MLGGPSVLATGAALSGILAYAFMALATRALGAADAAPISVLWTCWTLTSAALTFPVQHWVARTMAGGLGEAEVRAALPRLALVVLVMAGLVLLLVAVPRGVLFQSSSPLYPIALVALITGAAWTGLGRGLLIGRGRMAAAASAVAGENALRLLTAAVLAGIGAGAGAYAVALVAGSFILAGVRPAADTQRRRAPSLRLLAGIAGGSLLAQATLTSGPLLLSVLRGRPEDITSLFAALAVFRAPHLLANVVSVQLTGTLTRWVVEDRSGLLRSIYAGVVAGTGLGASASGLVAAGIGEPVLRLIFGPSVSLPSEALGVLAAGSTLGLGALALMLLCIARGSSGYVTTAWLVAIAAAGFAIVLPGTPLQRVIRAFVVAEFVAFCCLAILEGWRGRGVSLRQSCRPHATT